MSGFLPRRFVFELDPLAEHLANLQPEQVDALEMMRGVYSNQAAFGASLIAMHRHVFNTDNDVNDLASSVAGNTLPRLQAVADELEKQDV